ncbi:hypothetical protein AAIR98_001719 [Elusimicrobium simillimum]|uniref:hypothetical protein n=1 Tax=Elusimicrobium simillimum TaxID=3143438 RepID=UPI003C6F892A
MIGIFSTMLNGLRGKRGQFLLPAVMLVPIVLLIIYLIYETAKLSREKIKQQFAIDSSVVVEMQPAATILNATAYMNGAMPYRLFRGEMNIPIQHKDGGETLTIYDWFYRGGAFPGAGNMDDEGSWAPKDTDQQWDIKYAAGMRPGWDKEAPTLDEDAWLTLTDREISDKYYVNRTVFGQFFKMYMIYYNVLGDIQKEQYNVYKDLSEKQSFFRKSYCMNLGEDVNMSICGKEGARSFSGLNIRMDEMRLKKFIANYAELEQFGTQYWHFGAIDPPTQYVISDYHSEDSVYQFSFPDAGSRTVLKKMYRGVDVVQPFTPPNNYFNINLTRYNPRVRAKVSIQCGNKNNNCVWPKPTSKYQVRLEP